MPAADTRRTSTLTEWQRRNRNMSGKSENQVKRLNSNHCQSRIECTNRQTDEFGKGLCDALMMMMMMKLWIATLQSSVHCASGRQCQQGRRKTSNHLLYRMELLCYRACLPSSGKFLREPVTTWFDYSLSPKQPALTIDWHLRRRDANRCLQM